jgi:nucleoside-diphosphate-sugar epimerase
MAKCLVTGAGGFVGKALCLRLLAEGHQVCGLARGKYPDLERAGVRMYQIDLSQVATSPANTKQPDAPLAQALEGVQAVFHVAAKVEMWGHYQDFFAANVLGTRRLLQQARASGVRQFIFTSSPSVVAGTGDLIGVDESQAYPERHLAYYPQTKALAEREVLQAQTHDFATIALRPHLIFGPGDSHLVPTILEKADRGHLAQIGDGTNLTDVCFIDDCVQAHLDAWRALERNPAVGAKAYFISQGEPIKLWQWINQILECSGRPALSRKVPTRLAYTLATAFEGFAIIRQSLGGAVRQPRLTRFLVHEMASSHYFNISAARTALGYSPRYTIAQAMQRTFSAQAAESSPQIL